MKNDLKLFLITIYCVAAAFVVLACSMPKIDISDDTQEVLIRASARAAGYRFAQNNPDQAALAISHCDTILEAEDPQKIVTEALTHLDDPILAATIVDLISLIKIDMDGDIWEREMLLVAVGAFREGIEMAMEMPAFRRNGRSGATVRIDDDTTAEEWQYIGERLPYLQAQDRPLEYSVFEDGFDARTMEIRPGDLETPGMFNEDYFPNMGM